MRHVVIILPVPGLSKKLFKQFLTEISLRQNPLCNIYTSESSTIKTKKEAYLKLVKIIETARETSARLATLSEKDRTGSSGRRVMVSIRLDQSQTYQTFEGFGGALTESAAYALNH